MPTAGTPAGVAVPTEPRSGAGASAAPPARPRPPATTAGWGAPSYVDDFSEATLDPADWNVYDSPTGKPPRTPAAVRLTGGQLRIVGGVDAQGRDVSGGVGSRRERKYGRWEVRFRVDRGAGYSAVALLWPQHDTDWPAAGEIDFTEVNKGARAIDHIIVHNGPSNAQQGSVMHADFTQWHTVGVEWEPDHVAFYLDGVRQSFVVTSTAMVPSLTPMHLALQLDQGCDGWVECRNAQTPPQVAMDVDWVKVYAP